MVLFTKRRNFEGFFAPKLSDPELIPTNQVQYLGVILDISIIIRKPKVVNWIYTSVIRPMVKNTSENQK
jgi:hypothetical protein